MNTTADNLPGAGRTLGLFYSSAGRQLEVLLGRIAGRLGRGPQATALRIQKNSGIVTRPSVLPVPLSVVKSRKKIEKDCKRLLKYVGLNALSKRRKALDHIIDLSFDHHVRDLLKVMGAAHFIELAHKDLFVRSDFDVALLSRSRKALVSVTDDMLMQEIKDLDTSSSKIFNDKSSNVWTHARDPDRSFIVVRWALRKNRFSLVVQYTLDYLDVVVDTSPEWECVDQFLNGVIGELFNHQLTKTVEIVFRHTDKLPQMVGSETFQWFMEDRPFEEDHAHWTVILLRSFARQSRTVGDEFSCIDWDYVRHLYPHSALWPLFDRLWNVPDLVFYQIVHERVPDNFYRYDLYWVVQSETLRRLCEELAFFTDRCFVIAHCPYTPFSFTFFVVMSNCYQIVLGAALPLS
ncbi:hypothetical protein DFH11DRAFT_1765478 [Phellopilus nigrolimitatus]|nr:hypothetical protein DFH11DRAFT_1765478 [Phellopilus nigrolimitatus]